MKISDINTLDELTAYKQKLRGDITAKEKDLVGDYELAKARLHSMTRPLTLVKNIAGIALSFYGGTKGHSIAYKLGYGLATRLLSRKKK